MSVRKICILALDCNGIPLSAVIALKCPEIRVSVVQKNSEFIFSMNSGKIPHQLYVPGIEELLRKSQNKNLAFTTNEREAVKEAQIIFIMSNSKLKEEGEGKKQTVDLSMIEDAAFLIAENAEHNKIIVENSPVPLRTAECVRSILKRYCKLKIEFEVVSSPEFYEQGSPLKNLLNPDCVLIGSENTPKGLAAAQVIAGIYERWMPSKRIVLRNTWSAELSKICTYAMVAQTHLSLQSIALICERSGGDISVFRNVFATDKNIGTEVLNPFFHVGKFPLAVRNLVYLCEFYNFTEGAKYWQAVLDMHNFNKMWLFKNLIFNLNGSVTNREVVLLGFASFKDTVVTQGSSAVELCTWLLEEGALVNIYSSKMSNKSVINALMSSGCRKPTEEIEKLVTVFEDPYTAAQGAQVIILCCSWPEFVELDYEKIYTSMKKPAYIFDNEVFLPHSELLKIGFEVFVKGKFIPKSPNVKNTDIF